MSFRTGRYMRNRHYSPGLGRFVSIDRIGVWDDALNAGNGQAYGSNSPLNVADPMGLQGSVSFDRATQKLTIDGKIFGGWRFDKKTPGSVRAGLFYGKDEEGKPIPFGSILLNTELEPDPGDPSKQRLCIASVGVFTPAWVDAAIWIIVRGLMLVDHITDYIPGGGWIKGLAKRAIRGGLRAYAKQKARDAAKDAAKKLERELKEALRGYRTNKDFKRYLHRNYKRTKKTPGGGRDNPDLSEEQVLDAYREWQSLRGR